MKKLTGLLFIFLNFSAAAQQTEGIVTYEYAQFWTKIASRLSFLSREEKDRMKMTWGKDDGRKTKMKLIFSPSQSLYTYFNERSESDDGAYSWRNQDLLIARNFDQGTKTELIEMLGKTYLITDSLQTPSWQIMSQLKEIAGHVCMKAMTEDTVKKQKIAAWFAQDILVQAGPERQFGLPGLILELDINDGDVVISATNVEFKPVQKDLILPKMKGRKINEKEYNLLIWNHMRDSIKAYRNPYWAMRY